MVAALASMVAALASMVAACSRTRRRSPSRPAVLYDGTSASNLGEGADGKVAAPAQFSMQKAAMYLTNRGQITCRLPLRGSLLRCTFSTSITLQRGAAC